MIKYLFSQTLLLSFFCSCLMIPILATASPLELEKGMTTLKQTTGCYLVDYNYIETESLKAGYERDQRIYDVNKNKSVKEWIYAESISPTRILLQHILFATHLDGKLIDGSILKHTGDDWEFNAPYLYEFLSPATWISQNIPTTGNGIWLRRIKNLDGGLRHECASGWNFQTANPEWTCDNYAPIPGRETRDMGRKDYQALERSTRIIVYGNSWLERQANIKIIDENNTRTPLAKEIGKNWYIRLPDAECAPAQIFADHRKTFWELLRESWDEVLEKNLIFKERKIIGQPSRYFKISQLEEESLQKNLQNPVIRKIIKDKIINIIEEYLEK